LGNSSATRKHFVLHTISNEKSVREGYGCYDAGNQELHYKLIEVDDTYAKETARTKTKEILTDTTNQATALANNENLLRVCLFASSNGPEPMGNSAPWRCKSVVCIVLA